MVEARTAGGECYGPDRGDGGTRSWRVLGNEEAHVEVQQFLSKAAESVELPVSEPHFDDDVSSLFPTEVPESLTKCGPTSHGRFTRQRREHSDLHWCPRRLRLGGERRGDQTRTSD